MRCDCGYDFRSGTIMQSYVVPRKHGQLTFPELMVAALKPSGRFSPAEFAIVFFTVHGLSVLAGLFVRFGHRPEGSEALFVCWIILSIPVTIIAGIRRLHDRDIPGIFIAFAFIPIVNIVMLLFLLLAEGNEPGKTRWG